MLKGGDVDPDLHWSALWKTSWFRIQEVKKSLQNAPKSAENLKTKFLTSFTILDLFHQIKNCKTY